jgi:phospho-N-acetylmuramoyl-pentapeptide-transferase
MSFLFAFLTALILIPLLKKLKVGQNILSYVDHHETKSGTPTMGGVIFVLPLVLWSTFNLNENLPLSIMIVAGSLTFGLIGFLDDFIKIKSGVNLGLRAYQKIVGMGGVALLLSYFYMRVNPNGQILIPFMNLNVEIGGFGIFLFTFIVLIATTNAVNLTDGLDGLAGSVSAVFLIFMLFLIQNNIEKSLVGGQIDGIEESNSINQIIVVVLGGLTAFLLFNTKKASIFMGDTGSLFLGGILATVVLFTGMGLFILILGICFVWSALSVIIQVTYFKITKGKRVFLMTPFHHHLEKIGWQEPKIVFCYVVVTVLAGLTLLLF